jgi:hypothetical protein
VLVYAVRTGPQLLTVALGTLDDQTFEIQREIPGGWETVATYRAARVTRVDGLPTGATYRALVSDSARFTGGASSTVNFWSAWR